MGRGTGIRTASKTSIQLDFRYRGIRCRERIKLDPKVVSSKNFVTQLKARIQHEIALGTFDYAKHFPSSARARKLARTPGSTLTWGELLTEWLVSVRATLEPETYGDYAEYVAHTWRPRVGGLRVSDPILPLIAAWVAASTASKKRILNVLTPLRQAARYACGPAKLLDADPLEGLTVVRPREPKETDIDPFSPAELAAIMAELEDQTANMVGFWAWTGLREGELFALDWPSINLEAGTARISKSSRNGRRKAPKTEAGERTIRLLAPALQALLRQRMHSQLKHGAVFLNPYTDEAWRHDKPLRRRWRAACVAVGVRYRPPRQLRHTFASWMLGAGENLLWVSKHMGHSNAAFTLRVYARLIPDLFPDAGLLAIAKCSKAG